MNILEISGLSKSFGGRKVIDNISFAVPENCVYGFIGVNGAGKTTTMKIILGLLRADSGEVHVAGRRITFGASKVGNLVGFLPDVPAFYNYMRPQQYLRLCGEIAGLDAKTIAARSDELLHLVGLSNANKKIGGFSRGMKQRLGVAQGLLSEPRLLICDEPTSALDPLGRKDVLDILSQIKGKTTVIFSTHILADVERICDRVAVLHKGAIALESAMSELKIAGKTNFMSLEYDQAVDSQEVLRVLNESNLGPSRYETAETSIESLFLEVAK